MDLTVLDTGLHSAVENMEIDRELLEDLDPNAPPLLHLYQWKKRSLTYGHFADPYQLLDFEGLKKHDIDHAKRVTGGGVTLHFTDFAFSFFMPKEHPFYSSNTLENYAFVNDKVTLVLRKFIKEGLFDFFEEEKNRPSENLLFCMAKPTRYDVMIEGKKIGGAAQRRTKRGYLHHGTISLVPPEPEILRDILLDKEKVYQAILHNSYSVSKTPLDEEALSNLRYEVSQVLISVLKSA